MQKKKQPPPAAAALDSPPVSPRGSDDSTKELFLLHHALNPEFIYNQQLLKNGVSIILKIYAPLYSH